MPAQCIGITQVGKQCKKNSMANFGDFCSIHLRKTPASVILNGVIIDYDTYINNNATKNISNVIKSGIDDNIIDDLGRSELITKCHCCLDDSFENVDLVQCSQANCRNEHFVCKMCLKRNIECQLESGIANLKCMFDMSDKCNGKYIVEYIKPLLTDEQNMKFMECLDMQEAIELAGICDNYEICPLCNKYGCIFENMNNAGPVYLDCGRCNGRWCVMCKRSAHGSDDCYKLNFDDSLDLDGRCSLIDKFIQDIVLKKLSHACSSCGTKYIKEDGCNLMTCPKCNRMTCYICNMSLQVKNGNKYWHFAGHGLADVKAKCPLWNNIAGDGKKNQGNLEFNNRQIFAELSKFVVCNNDNNDVSQLIYKRIVKHFEKDSKDEVSMVKILGVKHKLSKDIKLSMYEKRMLLLGSY